MQKIELDSISDLALIYKKSKATLITAKDKYPYLGWVLTTPKGNIFCTLHINKEKAAHGLKKLLCPTNIWYFEKHLKQVYSQISAQYALYVLRSILNKTSTITQELNGNKGRLFEYFHTSSAI